MSELEPESTQTRPIPASSSEEQPGVSSGFNVSAPFIRRPVATSLLSAAVIIAGLAAYSTLPVAALPQVEFSVISVSAALPGADPETMASAVSTPLERQFSRIAGINEMTSASSTGGTQIVMQFDLDRDINGAARDVQAAINAARSQLPANMPQAPAYKKANPNDQAVLVLALTSDTLTQAQLYDQADSVIAQRIAQVKGVGQVFVGGSSKPAVRIEANPMLLSQAGIGLEALRSAIASVNVNKPKGSLTHGDLRYGISTTDQLFDAADYAPLIVATQDGPIAAASPANFVAHNGPRGVIRIQDLGRAINSVEDVNTGGNVNGTPAVLINILRAPGANVIEMVDSVLKLLPQLQASIPPSIKLMVALNRTIAIRESVREVTHTLIVSILLVIAVVFLFLRDFRSTLIPSISIPLSLCGTFAVMRLLDYTLDNLSLMALTISTGFVVDDAIVVMENITRHLEAGLPPLEAALRGSREISFTVLSISTSLIAVFIPILLMGGIVGRLFREFAVTLSVSIIVSLIVSLTTTPVLSARLLRSASSQTRSWLYRSSEAFFDWTRREYQLGLRWALRHQAAVLVITCLTCLLNVYLYVIVPKGFFPQMDSGRLSGQLRGQQDVSFQTLLQKGNDLVDIVHSNPGVLNAAMWIGNSTPGGSGGNLGMMNIFLKPSEERRKTGDTAEVVLERLRRQTGNMPGMNFVVQSVQELTIGGHGTASQYQYSLSSDNLAELNEWPPRLMAAMQAIPVLKDIATDQQTNGLREQLVIDRETASRLGVTPLAIDNTLADAFGQRQVSTTYRPLNQYHVVMEVAPEFRQNPDALQNIFVKNTTGSMVPLAAFTHFETRRMPLTVNHQSQSPAVTLSFNLAPGASLSDGTTAVEEARNAIGMPSDIRGSFQGTAQAFQQSLATEPLLILLAIVSIYIVLGILYESLTHPLTILSTLPSAGVGAILALLLFKVELSVIAMVGIILLIGIVKKNAIMMVDFALLAERERGLAPAEAIYEACVIRFRPIMMTTMAALLGGVPLALGSGTGSELRRPLGITIIGGLVVSQALTLFTTPVVYLFFDKLGRRSLSIRDRLRRGRSLSHVNPASPITGLSA